MGCILFFGRTAAVGRCWVNVVNVIFMCLASAREGEGSAVLMMDAQHLLPHIGWVGAFGIIQ